MGAERSVRQQETEHETLHTALQAGLTTLFSP